jgi:3,4-dihydroxy-2-butanone 4-phosphate synthase
VALATIEEAVADIRDGRMIIIVDDEDRENEGDLVCAAEKVTPEIINFMARHARGLICLPLTEERCDELHLTTQVADNTSYLGTAFTVSIDARRGITTGISAADRATTILVAVDPASRPQDLAVPVISFPCAQRTAAFGSSRTNRSQCRHRSHRRSLSGRRDLRNHERRRHDVASASARDFCRPAQSENDQRR